MTNAWTRFSASFLDKMFEESSFGNILNIKCTDGIVVAVRGVFTGNINKEAKLWLLTLQLRFDY